MRRSIAITAFVALAALPLAACGDDDDESSNASTQTKTQQQTATQQETVPAAVSVSIGDNFYKPKDVTIQVGQSIKWRNDGAVAHTVTSDSDSTVKFDSGNLDPRGAYALKPATRGKLTYHCTIHGKVQSGTITVNR
jgi:plastocyanin